MARVSRKAKVIEKFRTHEKDSGSAEVQIAILSHRIGELATHLKANRKDNHSRRGLLAMVVKRKKLLDYLRQKNPKRYATIVKKIGLKR